MRVADRFAFNLAILLVSGGAGLGALMPSPALAQTATSTTATTELSEVVVTGTRAALVESLDRKRGAEGRPGLDRGRGPRPLSRRQRRRFALAHHRHHACSARAAAKGQYVNVRGLGPEFSIVTLNGRILATDGDGREFAFDVLPSEVISGADVLQVRRRARNLEGSIGGSINLAPRGRSTASACASRCRSKATTTISPRTPATR